ncbi:CDT1-like protein a, chloroplastic [Panicum miliaceum]|uniref:CDT1-like protein a, chloroplastic n=1 Tax=Panicum miliaceum TaxID=4540 RepID=A0A3L6Q8K5_PANMI|nr:CDT1-like protein a, chloroplastic [Panicum miliaceum]
MDTDAATPSKKLKTSAASGGTPQKLRMDGPVADEVLTPEKPTQRVTAAAAAAEQIWTPEKPEERPRARARSVAFSVKEVRRAALGLRRPEMGAPVADELESVERELGVGAGACWSPVKRKADVKLPESYEMLCEFFNCLDSSTRLLRMKGSKVTFPNICASIQHLSERRFTYSHLAQLKYIMPEAIVISKILLRDDTTCCMKPDLQVNLVAGAVESIKKQKGETAYSALRRIFRQRLVDFFRDHPEGDDIPEHELPHPFNQTRSSMLQAAPRTVSELTTPMESSDVNRQQAATMSHMSQSFKRKFSQRSTNSSATASATSPLAKVESTVHSSLNRNSFFSSNVSGSKEAWPEEDGTVVVSMSGVSEGTPAKYSSTPVRLMATTPDLKTPKRTNFAAGYGTPPLKMIKKSARAKLFTTPTKVKQKEQRALEEKETGFADQVKRQKLVSSLPSIFDVIFLIYQSRQRSVMTKQELLHKIIASSTKIVDRSEVEEQLTLLKELVPEWISEKTARSGDVCHSTPAHNHDSAQRPGSLGSRMVLEAVRQWRLAAAVHGGGGTLDKK